MEFNTRHILVVDDVINNLKITAHFLKEAGYRISLAQNGTEAMRILEIEIPDLILLDIMMPGEDGIELCKRIKKVDYLHEIPIIFLTAKNQTEDLVEGFNAGGVDYISKPYKHEEFLIRVKNHCELAFAKKKIVEMSKTRDKLYSIIAHDIRSPFASIIQSLDLISADLIDKNSQTFIDLLDDLKGRSNATYSLLSNLLEWTKFQSDKINIKAQQTNIHQVVTECITLLKGNAKMKNIEISQYTSNIDVAFCDEVMIHAVIRNLLSNAIKFTPENGKISIRSAHQNSTIAISVKDTGIGIAQEIIDKIFNKDEHFYSLGTNNEQGTGLGLLMVKDFVTRNLGSLSVSSTLGVGTEIILTLPVKH